MLVPPPYGAWNRATLQLARHRGLMAWLWSVDPQDWLARGSGSPYWVHRITGITKAQGGRQRHPVVLLHNQPGSNPAAVTCSRTSGSQDAGPPGGGRPSPA